MAALKNSDSLEAFLQNGQSRELLSLNPVLNEHGLLLTRENAEEILEARRRTLKDQGRIELDTTVTRELIQRLSDSPYINQDHFIDSINDLYEIFHEIKNKIPEFVSDEEVLDEMMSSFETVCRGSVELLMGKGADAIVHKYGSNSSENEKDEEEPN